MVNTVIDGRLVALEGLPRRFRFNGGRTLVVPHTYILPVWEEDCRFRMRPAHAITPGLLIPGWGRVLQAEGGENNA